MPAGTRPIKGTFTVSDKPETVNVPFIAAATCQLGMPCIPSHTRPLTRPDCR
jgi:hypothetical protein